MFLGLCCFIDIRVYMDSRLPKSQQLILKHFLLESIQPSPPMFILVNDIEGTCSSFKTTKKQNDALFIIMADSFDAKWAELSKSAFVFSGSLLVFSKEFRVSFDSFWTGIDHEISMSECTGHLNFPEEKEQSMFSCFFKEETQFPSLSPKEMTKYFGKTKETIQNAINSLAAAIESRDEILISIKTRKKQEVFSFPTHSSFMESSGVDMRNDSPRKIHFDIKKPRLSPKREDAEKNKEGEFSFMEKGERSFCIEDSMESVKKENSNLWPEAFQSFESIKETRSHLNQEPVALYGPRKYALVDQIETRKNSMDVMVCPGDKDTRDLFPSGDLKKFEATSWGHLQEERNENGKNSQMSQVFMHFSDCSIGKKGKSQRESLASRHGVYEGDGSASNRVLSKKSLDLDEKESSIWKQREKSKKKELGSNRDNEQKTIDERPSLERQVARQLKDDNHEFQVEKFKGFLREDSDLESIKKNIHVKLKLIVLLLVDTKLSLAPIIQRINSEGIEVKQVTKNEWSYSFISEKQKKLQNSDRVIIVGTHTPSQSINLSVLKEICKEVAAISGSNCVFTLVLKSPEFDLPPRSFEILDSEHLIISHLRPGSSTEICSQFDMGSFLATLSCRKH